MKTLCLRCVLHVFLLKYSFALIISFMSMINVWLKITVADALLFSALLANKKPLNDAKFRSVRSSISPINWLRACDSLTDLITWPWCRAAFPGSWNTLPPSSLSRGSVSSLCTPMHRSITLNQPDNSIQRGNWHHLLLVGLAGDWQMIGLVSSIKRAIYHCAHMSLTSLSD